MAQEGGGGHLVPTGPKEDLAPLMVAAKGQTPGSAYLGYDQSPSCPGQEG